MTCKHLQKLFQLCQQYDIKMSSSDVVRIACGACQRTEVCPAVMLDEHEWLSPSNDNPITASQSGDGPGTSLDIAALRGADMNEWCLRSAEFG